MSVSVIDGGVVTVWSVNNVTVCLAVQWTESPGLRVLVLALSLWSPTSHLHSPGISHLNCKLSSFCSDF